MKLTVTASNSVGSVAPLDSVLTQAVRGVPVNLAGQGPIVSGTLVRGQTLTATSGKWTGYWQGGPPLAFTHRWQRCNASGAACVDIGTAPVAVPLPGTVQTCTSLAPCDATSTYALTDADMGSTIHVIVKATNGGGTSADVVSPVTGVVRGAPQILQASGAPDPNAIPKINGLAQAGLNIGASTGSWSAFPGGETDISYAYQWMRCSGADPGSCSAISGATAAIYAVQDADVGQRLRIRITATNGVDPPGVAFSDATAQVAGRSAGVGGDGVDLLLSLKASSSGGRLTYTLTVTNAGTRPASGVVVNAALEGTRLVSATAPGGCSGSGPVACTIGGLAAGASASATVVVEASQTGVVKLSASAGAAESDVNPTNNAVSLSTFLIVTGSAPQAGSGTGGSTVAGGLGVDTTANLGRVAAADVRLKARRVGSTWVVSTRFSLVAGKAKLRLTVTRDGATQPLSLLKGSRLGTTLAASSRPQLVLDALRPTTFPIKVVVPAKGFSLQQIYVIHITATAANGASSRLDLGFKGVKLIAKKTTAKAVGRTWVASSTVALRDGATIVQAWVNRGTGAKKLALLKGSRLGGAVSRSSAMVLRLKAKSGVFPVRVVLPARGFSPRAAYVIRVQSRSAKGIWADYEIRFSAAAASLASRG